MVSIFLNIITDKIIRVKRFLNQTSDNNEYNPQNLNLFTST